MFSIPPRTAARRYISLVAGVGTLVAMTLLSSGPARAAATGGTAARAHATAKVAPVRRVCAPAKTGFASCLSLVRTNVPARKGLFPADSTPSGYGPADLQSAYNLPSATGGPGATVAIVDAYDDPDAEADLQTYRAQYGLPVCDTANGCFEKVNQEGQQGSYPAKDSSWGEEESLDVDMVSAICPNCHILLVEAKNNSITNLGVSVNEAISLGAQYVSNSYGASESRAELTWDSEYYNHPGVAITASAGDSNYGVEYPSASQYVTAVGGTSLIRDSGVPRGWTERVWGNTESGGTGSGCAAYEPKPSWQHDSGCKHRTVADVSADANPATGVAVYDSYGLGGWAVFGGTSVASPIIASTYALAGSPAAGSYPASYPYDAHLALNDVTVGSNGSCTPAYLCTAEPGYDGPTGWGTPNGVAAFTGAHAGITGRITDKVTGDPIPGVTVSTAQGYTATTNAKGHYDLTVPPGSYDLSVQSFGYKAETVTGLTLGNGQAVRKVFALVPVPRHTVSGTITDGSGHKWPLYAQISISGDPDSPVYTDPYTGAYSVPLPQRSTYQLQVTPIGVPGYQAKEVPVHLYSADKIMNIKLPVVQAPCTAPGYGQRQGLSTQFTGWSGTTPQDGWTITDNVGTGQTWNFSDPGGTTPPPGAAPPPGSAGQFASVDSTYYGEDGDQDTSLVSPVVNLTKVSAPVIQFSSYGLTNAISSTTAVEDVDLSLDGGQTWTSVWSSTSTNGQVSVPIPQAAGQADIKVRFTYSTDSGAQFFPNDYTGWEIDNVAIGAGKCSAVPGGLVAGTVTDANIGTTLGGATVTGPAGSQATAAAAGTSGGFYEVFSPSGSQQITAADTGYAVNAQTVRVAGDTVTRQDFAMQAGMLSISPASGLSGTAQLGNSVSSKLTFTNTGAEAVHVTLSQENDGTTPMTVQKAAGTKQPGTGSAASPRPIGKTAAGAPLRQIKAHVALGTSLPRTATKPTRQASQPSAGSKPQDAAWTSLPGYPYGTGYFYPSGSGIIDNSVAYDNTTGEVYSVGGRIIGRYSDGGNTADGYAYDPASQAWSEIASAPEAPEQAGAAFADGTLYLIGGWVEGSMSAAVYAYHPGTNSWSQVASMPVAVAAAGVAVLNGQIYVVGGCTTVSACVPGSTAVQRYNPASNMWTRLAKYPNPVTYGACAGIGNADEIVCAGGADNNSDALSSTYIYDPTSNSWSQGADMPYANWGMVYAGANQGLQVADGVTYNSSEQEVITNQAAQYDPAHNDWSLLPNSSFPEYRGGGACGLYQIGGYDSSGTEQPTSETLAGYASCGTSSLPWLTESQDQFTANPGQTVTVTVTLSSASLAQPGTYHGELAVSTDTPYQISPIPVTFQVNPPASWGKVTGTVTDATTGQPIPGATVQICTFYSKASGSCGTGSVSYTLRTDNSGDYQLWLPQRDNPLQVIAAMDGYQQQVKVAKISKDETTILNFALSEDPSATARQKTKHHMVG